MEGATAEGPFDRAMRRVIPLPWAQQWRTQRGAKRNRTHIEVAEQQKWKRKRQEVGTTSMKNKGRRRGGCWWHPKTRRRRPKRTDRNTFSAPGTATATEGGPLDFF